MKPYRIEFITPLFSRGAYDDLPEIRPPSIRGQLHWWFRAIGGGYADENAIFGGVHGRATASKVVLRVAEGPAKAEPAPWIATLPHKPAGRDARSGPNAPRAAIAAGSGFSLLVSERLGGLSDAHRSQFERALHSWLLAGSLGLRSTRGGGAFHWNEAPSSAGEFRKLLSKMLGGAPLRFDLIEESFRTAEEARKVITETISHEALRHLSYPLGAVRRAVSDPAPSRKTSPLRLTVRRFADGFRILAVWDNRSQVTGNTSDQLRGAIDLLADGTSQSKPTRIGKLLRGSSLSR